MSFYFQFLFCMLLVGCQTGLRTSQTRPTLEDILKQRATKPLEIVKWLKHCARDCLQPDAEIANDLATGYEILFSIAEKNRVK